MCQLATEDTKKAAQAEAGEWVVGVAFHNGLAQRKLLIEKMKEHALQLQQRDRAPCALPLPSDLLSHYHNGHMLDCGTCSCFRRFGWGA